MIHGPVNDKDVCSYTYLTEIAGLNSNSTPLQPIMSCNTSKSKRESYLCLISLGIYRENIYPRFTQKLRGLKTPISL